jgi:glycosyltransferase involved in cell wall biosynthesis
MVAHSFPRADGDVAGAFLWRLGEGLVDRGHEVTVLAPADRGDVGEPRLGRVRVRRVRYAAPGGEVLAYTGTMHLLAARNPLLALNFGRMLRALARAVDEEIRTAGAQVVHAHWWVPGGLAVRYAKRHGRPFIVTLHGSDVRLAGRVPGGRALMASVLRQAAAVTAVSSFLAAEAAQALGVPRTSLPVTPMPLGAGFRGDLDAARAGAVFVGRLVREKGVHLLLDALAVLRREGLPLDLTVIGDGPERGALKAQARAMGLAVTFAGFVPPESVGDHLRDKQVFVFPALHDEPGSVVAEALLHGVPVVATRGGGVADYLADPEAGILVPPSDVPALTQAIREVVTHDRFRSAAWRAGRILGDRLSPERVAVRFEELYSAARTSRTSLARPTAVG